MKKILAVLILGVWMFGVAQAHAQTKLGETKLGYVDIDRAANESEEGKKAIGNLKELMSSKQAAVTEKGKSLEKMKGDLEKQGAVMSAEARKAKIEEAERAERDFQRMLADVKQELEKKQRELTESVYKEIMGVIEKIGQEENYSAILPVQQLLYADKALDLTEEVIKRYNAVKGAAKTDAKADAKAEQKKKK